MGLVSISIFNLCICLAVLLFLLFRSSRKLSLDNQKRALTLTILAGLFSIVSQIRNVFDLLLPGNPQSGEVNLVPVYGILDLPAVLCLALATYYLTRSDTREIAPLIKSANLDPLTALYNMGYFRRAAARRVEQSKRYGMPLSLAMLDLDDFKSYNDTFGHEAGNDVLKLVSEILTRSMRADDIVARYGGEEFVVLLNCDMEHARSVFERVRQNVEKLSTPGRAGMTLRRVTVSIGVSAFDGDTDSVEELIQTADAALYEAKSGGKNRVIISTSMEAA